MGPNISSLNGIQVSSQGGQSIYVWLEDGAGNKDHSNRATSILYYDNTAPTDGWLSAAGGDRQVTLSWGGFSDSGGSGLKSTNTFKVVRNTGTYPNDQCTNGVQIYLGNGDSTTDSNLNNGTHYFYRVCAYDNAGNISTGATSDATPQPSSGSLQVTISPQGAIDAGAQWRVDGGAWHSSGYTQTGLSVGQHTVEFSDVSGWTKPGNKYPNIVANQTTYETGTYTAQTGSLQVTISPQGAIDAEAQWRVDGGTWRNSGYTQTGLSVGQHTVEFSEVSGWGKPGTKYPNIVANQTTYETGTYTAQTGSLQVTISPQGAIDAGAQWRVDGGTWRNSGYTQTGLSVGQHTVEFSEVSGWGKPGTKYPNIIANQTTYESGTYTQLSFVTNTDSVTVPEGGTATFQVKLSAQPSSAVFASVSRFSGDTDITVQSGSSLTFTTSNWNTYQTVTLGAAEDADTTNGTATIRISASGIPNKDVTATESDNDALSFVINTDSVTVPEGSTATFQVMLSSQPASTVYASVSRVSGDSDINVQSGSSLTFTSSNWNTYQTVTLSAAEDADTTNGTATIRISASGIPNKDITATESDNDALSFVTNTDSLTVPEGGTATLQVKLSAQPASTVYASVSRYSGDSDISVQSGSSLTFTSSNWNTYQTVTLSAAEDADTTNGTATIRISASGIPNKDITATESDNDICIASVPLDHWKGEYFNNKNLSGSPSMVRDDGAGTIDFNWGTGSPSSECGLGEDNFSVRWTRDVYLDAGTYPFTVTSDDGFRLYIDDQLILDKWFDQPPTIYTVNVTLSTGSHPIKLEYYENGGGAVAKLSWEEVSCIKTVPQNHWKGEYFDNRTLSGSPSMVRDDGGGFIDFQWWDSPSPACGLPAENFSVRWTRTVYLDSGTYRFTVISDDGFRLYVDGQLKLDEWFDQGPTTYSVDVPLSSGDHTVKLEYYQAGGGAIAYLTCALTSSANCIDKVSSDHWKGEYFNNKTLRGFPTMVRDDGTGFINFNWGTGSPSSTCGIEADNFSVRWTRTVSFNSGTYRFTVTSDDGVRIYIDDQLILDKWFDQAPTTYEKEVSLSAGDRTIKMEYYEATGGAVASLFWTSVTPGVWRGEYFNNRNLSGDPVMVRNDGNEEGYIDFNWGVESPCSECGLGSDNFSVRWTRTIYFNGSIYRFTVTSDDGFRLYIDDQLILDKWFDQAPTTYEAEVSPSAGDHTIKMEYYEAAGGALASLSWKEVGCIVSVPQDHWKGEYFDNKTLSSSPLMVRDDGTGFIDFWWPDSPGNECGLGPDNFSVRWTRSVYFDASTYRFTVTGDDGFRLYIDDQLILDKWIDQPPTTYTADVPLSAGNHSIKMEYYEAAGGAVASLTWTQGSCIVSVLSDHWKGEYFNNDKTFSGSPAMVRDDGTGFINFNWGTGSPSSTCGIGADNFSVRWTRTVSFTSGTYRFTVTSDDGFRLYVDGTLKLDKWFDQPPTTYTVDVQLTAGNHTITMEYYENGVGAVAKLSWERIETPVCISSVSSDHWKGEYFNNKTLSGSPSMVRDDGDGYLNFDWGTGSPSTSCGIGVDNFSVRWTRTLYFNAGTYRFTVTSDDGFRLYIDDRLFLDKWFDQAPTTYTVDFDLTAGNHHIQMTYYENGGWAVAKLSWEALATLPDHFDVPTIHRPYYNFTSFTRQTFDGTYTLLVPTELGDDWWRNIFLFPAWDIKDNRINYYRNAFLEALMQPQISLSIGNNAFDEQLYSLIREA